MKTPDKSPSMDDWKRLYDLIAQVKTLEPWDWMAEDDIFGFQMPGTGELGFISVMGAAGEHFSMAIYRGMEALDGFWNLQELGNQMTPEALLQIPQLQASLVNREDITDKDRKVMKELGLKFRGANAWPQFRSYRPGCFPWYVEKDEAAMLICGLEQLLDVAPRYREDFDILAPTDDDDDYLVRVQKNGTWQDTTLRVQHSPGRRIVLKMNMATLTKLKQMKQTNLTIEVDFSMEMNPVQDHRDERPYFPYLFMVCDHDSKMILAVNMISPFPSLEDMWGDFPAKVVDTLSRVGRPKELVTRNDFLKSLLEPVGAELGCKVKKSARLPAIDTARREFERFM